MAKKKNYDEQDGVWRTIGGRRVFIRTGQSLSDAMKESGKFGNKKEKTEVKNNKIPRDFKKGYGKFKVKTNANDNLDDRFEITKDEYGDYHAKNLRTGETYATFADHLRNGNVFEFESERVGEKEENAQKKYIIDTTKLKGKYETLPERTEEEKASDERYANAKAMYKLTGDEKYKKIYQDEIKKTTERVMQKVEKQKNLDDTFEVGDLKTKALETLPKDHIDSHEGDLYIKKTPASEELLSRMKNKDNGLLTTFKDQQTGETWYDIPFANMEDDYKSDRQKIKDDIKRIGDTDIKSLRSLAQKVREKQKTGNDYLPKASKVEKAGTSNRKEVSDSIQAHILEHYDNPVDFMEQMDAMDWLPTRWRAGEELASGGNYLIYYDDQREFLNSLNINPKGKSFSDDRVFQTYNSLIGRESERLYNRLEKLFEQYKKEHKNSNATLDDFRKWFK